MTPNVKKEIIVTSIIAILLFTIVVSDFVGILRSYQKLFFIEAVIHGMIGLSVFFLYIHITLGYTVDRKLAAFSCWILLITLFAIIFGSYLGSTYIY